YAGSARAAAPFGIARQAADCLALLRYLGLERAHVVGHSSAGTMALQLALDAPQAVHSLVLLEAALLDVPRGALIPDAVGPSIERYQAGAKAAATDGFLRWAVGPGYRAHLDRLIPGAFEQAAADADAWFAVELPSLQEWRFTQADAARITQPV